MSSGEESLDDEIENDLQIVEEGGEIIQEGEEVSENFIDQVEVNNEETHESTTENQEETAIDNKKVVKPKRIIKNPQPKLNEQTLQGPKGLSTIDSYFERVKYKGRGYEEHDLNILMKTYEHWCHRLFPKFPFDACVERLEKLGTKRGTQTQIKMIRMGLAVLDPEKPIGSDEDDNREEENHTGGFVDTYNDQFDQLLPSTSNQPQSEISEDQMERIRQNKERAQRLREERLRKIKEKAQNSLGQLNETVTQSSQLSTKNSHSDNLTSNNSQSGNENRLGNQGGNIENVLGFINAEEESRTKNHNNILESDSEDEIVGKVSKDTIRNVNVRRHILESDEDEEVNVQNENNKCTNNKVTESDEDFENILAEINTDENSVSITNATVNVANEEKNNIGINSENKTQNMESDSDKENSNENISCEMRIDENVQNIKEFSAPGKINEEVMQVSESYTPQDNSNRLMLQSGNAVSNSINEVEIEEDMEDDMENILTEINSDSVCVADSALNIEGKGNKTLHINESEAIDNIEQNKEIVEVSNDCFQEGNTTPQNGSSIRSEDEFVNHADVQNQAQAAEIDKEKHYVENSLSSTTTNNGSPQEDNTTNVQNIDSIENTVSNDIKGTEYVSRENEEWKEALNNISPQVVTVNVNEQVTLNQPMDTID